MKIIPLRWSSVSASTPGSPPRGVRLLVVDYWLSTVSGPLMVSCLSMLSIVYEEYQEKLEPLREDLNRVLETTWREWEIPWESGNPWPGAAAAAWLTARCSDNTDADKATALRILNTELGRNYTLDDVPDQPRDPWKPEADESPRQWWKLRIC